MNVKAIMFAGLGLFAVAVPTTMWISSDMQAIEARQRAKLEAECARETAAPAAVPVGTPAATGLPPTASVDGATAAAAPAEGSACAELRGTAKEADAGASGSIDPATGQPLVQGDVDPYAAGTDAYGGDPATYGGDPGAYGGDPGAYGGDASYGGATDSYAAGGTADTYATGGDPAMAATGPVGAPAASGVAAPAS